MKIQNPKIEDVARLANVSIMSVSRAMRGVEGVSEQKREEIIKIAQKIGYHPSNAAATLAAASSPLIGVSIPTLFGTVFAEIFNSMRPAFDNGGFQTIFNITDYSEENEELWVERMISWRPAGLILTGTDHSKKTKRLIQAANIPTLEIWDFAADPIDICVGINHYAAGEMIGNHIADLGYQRPAYVGVRFGKDLRSETRLSGIKTALNKKGIEFTELEASAEAATFKAGMIATEKILTSSIERPDVIFYLNDNMAFGGMMCCDKLGLKTPENIGIVGSNDLNINSVLNTKITTTNTPLSTMGSTAAQNLIAKISGARIKRAVALPVEVEIGQTTCAQ